MARLNELESLETWQIELIANIGHLQAQRRIPTQAQFDAHCIPDRCPQHGSKLSMLCTVKARTAVRSCRRRLALLPLHLLEGRLSIAPRERLELLQIGEA